MDSVEEWDDVLSQLRDAVAKQRGYAGFWEWPDKAVKERGIAASLLEVATDLPRMSARTLRSRPPGSDPPDCMVNDLDGGVWGIEVTELVDQKAIERARRGRPQWASWDASKLRDRIASRLARKDQPAKIQGGPYVEYLVLLFSGEALLSESAVRQYLDGFTFGKRKAISRAYLLLDYDPKSQTTPLIRLSLGQGA